MDALAGFAGHCVRIERQVHRISQAIKSSIDNTGQRVVVRASYEDPSQPDVVHNRIIRANDYIAANSENGSNTQQHSLSVLIFLYAYWDEEIRPRLAILKDVDVQEIKSDIMGDLRLLRNGIIHNKGILSDQDHRRLKKLGEMFSADQPIHVSYNNMHKIFVLIKQDCTRMLFKWLGVKDAPILPEDIVDVAIQKPRINLKRQMDIFTVQHN